MKIVREFYTYSQNATLVLNNPISIQFINCYDGIQVANEGQVTINNVFTLVPYWKSLGLAGSPLIQPNDFASPYFLNLENSINENDVTEYKIRFAGNYPENRLFVIVKYKIDN
tara:strand:- start:253 stop:591 length:339 start_codon:yes stop_codon:yes gene_type:complete